eukprot:scaffold2736_cov82-Skeletonema_dohrnii-CCMP3373.AAC.15
MIPLRNALIELGGPQPPSPIQCNNSTAMAVGMSMTNCNLIPRKSKSWNLLSSDATKCTNHIPRKDSIPHLSQFNGPSRDRSLPE